MKAAMLRALLVDDQPRVTARLTALLGEIGGIEVIGTARMLTEARVFLSGRELDVVFWRSRSLAGTGWSCWPTWACRPT